MIDAETDSRERERRQLSLEDEKMEFFAAIEQGKLVLGDTLVHIAARLAHVNVLGFLLQADYPVPPPSNAASSVGPRVMTPGVPQTPSKLPPAPLPLVVPNFRGELPRDVVAEAVGGTMPDCDNLEDQDPNAIAAAAANLHLMLAGASDVHTVFGAAYRDEPKVHRMVWSLCRLWPRWMCEGQQEAALLVRVLYDARSSDAAFSGLVRVAMLASERCRVVLALEGIRFAHTLLRGIQVAGANSTNHTSSRQRSQTKLDDDVRAGAERILTKELSRDDKLGLMEEWFVRWFSADTPGHSQGRRSSTATGRPSTSDGYVAFFDAAAPSWLQLAQTEPTLVAAAEMLPPSYVRPEVGTSLDSVLANAAVALKRHELQLWKRRVRPPPAEMDDLGTHISALEAFAQLRDLKA